jgi:hypothetical protein
MSCLFQSLSAFIEDTDASKLRHIIADYLEKNPILYDNEKIGDIVSWEHGNPTLEQYVARMRMPSTWGGAIEIKAFCDMFQIGVHVLVLRDRKTIEFQPSNMTAKDHFTITWNGAHYEPQR